MEPPAHPVTLTEVAKLAGTSASTVSRVLSRDARISQATRDRVLQVLTKHRYQPNLFARALKGGATGQLAVLASNISSGFFAEVLHGMDAATRARGIHLVCSFAHHTNDYLAMTRELLTNRRTDGLLLIDPPLELFAQPLPPGPTPAVLCASRPAPASPWHRLDSVTVDNDTAMRTLVDHLADQGFRRLIHLAGPANTFDAQARRAAFRKAIKARPELTGEVIDGHLIAADGERTAERLRCGERPPAEALVCFNDSTAQGVATAWERADGPPWRENGHAVSGWDDTPVGRFIDLTTVAMPTHELGRQAAECLLDRLADRTHPPPAPRHLELPATVVVRSSTRRHAPEARP